MACVSWNLQLHLKENKKPHKKQVERKNTILDLPLNTKSVSLLVQPSFSVYLHLVLDTY